MGVIVDTSVLVAAERGDLDLPRVLAEKKLGAASIGIAAITASELLHGVHRATDAGRRAQRAARVDRLLDAMPIYAFGLSEARRHAELWAHLARGGTPIGAHDMLIAATAMARGDALLTLNVDEFGRVPGLEVVAALSK